MNIKFLALIIISVMVFLIMLAAILLIKDLLKEDSKIQKCKASVVKASTISKAQLNEKLKRYSYADCPRINLGLLEIPDKNPQRKMAKVLVDEFNDCWYKFGEGKLNPLPGDLWDQAVRCYVCSSFKVDKYVPEGTERELNQYFMLYEDKWNYLKTAFLYGSSGPIYRLMASYKDASNFNKLKEDETFLKDPDPSFQENEIYYIINMFIIDKDGIGWGNLGSFFGLYTQKTQSKMAIVSEKNIRNVCYSLEN